MEKQEKDPTMDRIRSYRYTVGGDSDKFESPGLALAQTPFVAAALQLLGHSAGFEE